MLKFLDWLEYKLEYLIEYKLLRWMRRRKIKKIILAYKHKKRNEKRKKV